MTLDDGERLDRMNLKKCSATFWVIQKQYTDQKLQKVKQEC